MRDMEERHYAVLRRHMVEVIGIHVELMQDELGRSALDQRVMSAMLGVPRHLFVPAQLAPFAYHDTPLPIGFDKTISQPFMVALMTDLLELERHDSVLEVGTGLGYQTAVLADLVGSIRTVEIIEEFAAAAEERLRRSGHGSVQIRVGDGSRGWAEHAPYDKIIVTAAADDQPPQGAAGAAQAGGTDGAAGRSGRRPDAHHRGQGRRRALPVARADPRPVQPARNRPVKTPLAAI